MSKFGTYFGRNCTAAPTALKVVKLDVDANNQTAAKYGVRSIPLLKIFKNGKEIGSKVGALPKRQLESFIKDMLNS